MLKKVVSVFLIGLVMNLSVFAGETEKDKKFAEKVKSEISKLGTGIEAKIKVKLKDGTKIKGYVTEVKADSFVVMNEKTSTTVEVPYSQAKQVKGNNLSKGAKIAIGVGITVAVVLVVAFLIGKSQ